MFYNHFVIYTHIKYYVIHIKLIKCYLSMIFQWLWKIKEKVTLAELEICHERLPLILLWPNIWSLSAEFLWVYYVSLGALGAGGELMESTRAKGSFLFLPHSAVFLQPLLEKEEWSGEGKWDSIKMTEASSVTLWNLEVKLQRKGKVTHLHLGQRMD